MRWLVFVILWAGMARAEPVVIFAAASLKAPMDAIFAHEDAPEVVISYGGSGAMAQQIAQGAPADVFVSANTAWMVWLQGQGIALDAIPLLSNRLVVIGAAGATPGPLIEVLDGGRIAMGQVNSVPAGIYGREALEALGLWGAVSGRIVEVPSVTAATRLVALGEVPLGLVYATDALATDAVVVLADVPSEHHNPIAYPIAGLTQRGAQVVAHLQGDEATQVFADHGFVVMP